MNPSFRGSHPSTAAAPMSPAPVPPAPDLTPAQQRARAPGQHPDVPSEDYEGPTFLSSGAPRPSSPRPANSRATKALASDATLDDLREREVLLASTAHELIGSLTGVLGFARRLEGRAARDPLGQMSPGMREDLASLIESSERLRRVTSSYIEVIRGNADALPMAIETYELEPILTRCVLAMRAQHPDFEIVERYPNYPVQVDTDEERLEEVLTNLLQNAYRYGGRKATVILRDYRREVAIAVQDVGPGVPLRDTRRIFTRFYRAHDTILTARGAATRSGAGGTEPEGGGLGLYISSQHLTRMGGSISVRNVTGAGAEFKVTLPLASPPATSSTTVVPIASRRRSIVARAMADSLLPTEELQERRYSR